MDLFVEPGFSFSESISVIGSEEVPVDTASCPLSSKMLDGGGVSSSLPNNNQSRADRKQEVAETIQLHSSAADGGNGPA